MLDQCVASASNFSVGIVVARISGPAGFGAFALAYTVWTLLTSFHRSLITDPMAIMGDMRHEERDDYIRRGFAADVTLGLMAAFAIAAVGAVFLAVGQHTFGIGLLSVAPWLVVLDLQDYWRWIGFMLGKPKKSLVNDLLFNVVQALAFGAVFVLHLHSVFAVVSAWGLGAAVAAVYGLRQFSVRPSVRGGGAFLWSRWPTSRWLASERAANWGANQLYLVVAGAMLGPAALGGLKAAQGLVAGPTNLVMNAGGSFGLPEATRQLAERGWTGMVRISRIVTGAGVAAAAACAIAVLLAAPALLKFLYGPKFVSYAPSAQLFAVAIVVAAFFVGPTLTLTATRRIVPLVIIQLGRMVLTVALTFVVARGHDVTGVATVNLVTGVVALVAMWAIQSRARRSVEAMEPPPGVQPEAMQPQPEVVQPEVIEPPPEVVQREAIKPPFEVVPREAIKPLLVQPKAMQPPEVVQPKVIKPPPEVVQNGAIKPLLGVQPEAIQPTPEVVQPDGKDEVKKVLVALVGELKKLLEAVEAVEGLVEETRRARGGIR
jgi:O-antigen/teichoic acid export membrane protein